MYGGREALPDDHKFRGQRGRVRARYRRPQLGRGTEKISETSQRKTNLQLASGAFSCKVAPFTPAGERTKKAPSRGGRTGSNGQQHPVVIDCEVLQERRSCAERSAAFSLIGGSLRSPAGQRGRDRSPGSAKAVNVVPDGTTTHWAPSSIYVMGATPQTGAPVWKRHSCLPVADSSAYK